MLKPECGLLRNFGYLGAVILALNDINQDENCESRDHYKYSAHPERNQ